MALGRRYQRWVRFVDGHAHRVARGSQPGVRLASRARCRPRAAAGLGARELGGHRRATGAIGWALESGTPLLGTCGGFQYVVLALAKRLAGIEDAAHAEVDPDSQSAVVAPLACSLVGEEREVTCVPGTRLAAICGTEPFIGLHWCSYGLGAGFVARLEEAGVVISAHAPDAGVEGIELPEHPFCIATLFQPQVGAAAGRPLHPLIMAFADAARAAVNVA
jgi:CTP synthase (UTP-ammonia lyase)